VITKFDIIEGAAALEREHKMRRARREVEPSYGTKERKKAPSTAMQVITLNVSKPILKLVEDLVGFVFPSRSELMRVALWEFLDRHYDAYAERIHGGRTIPEFDMAALLDMRGIPVRRLARDREGGRDE